jgi:glycosyltransferase involved in cell wall biosynthesis
MNHVVSIVIPSRNEKFLKQTIKDLLSKATGDIEIIPVLDGYWPASEELVNDKRVHYLHFSNSRGMRNAINSAVRISKGDYLFKIDAHCMVADGYDTALKADCQPNWVVVPRRLALDPHTWTLIDNPKYPVDYMYLSNDFHGEVWTEKNQDQSLKSLLIDDLMSFQGSAWFMHKSYFDFLELMDEESYGSFPYEAQEIGLKCWLSGGRVVVNKKTWYAHWHKTKEDGRGYSLDKSQVEKGTTYMQKWHDQGWHKQTKPLSWLFTKFER